MRRVFAHKVTVGTLLMLGVVGLSVTPGIRHAHEHLGDHPSVPHHRHRGVTHALDGQVRDSKSGVSSPRTTAWGAAHIHITVLGMELTFSDLWSARNANVGANVGRNVGGPVSRSLMAKWTPSDFPAETGVFAILGEPRASHVVVHLVLETRLDIAAHHAPSHARSKSIARHAQWTLRDRERPPVPPPRDRQV